MAPKFAGGLRACCVALALVLATAHAAEPKPSLMGATREQVLQRYGEPKSLIAAGAREVMFFARERVVLRNGVVVEIEALPADVPVRRPPPPPPSEASTPASGPPATSQPSGQVAAPAAPDSAGAPGSASSPAPAHASSTDAATVVPAAPAEPSLAIKFVRPPSAASGGSAPKQETTPVAPRVVAPPAEPVVVAEVSSGRPSRAPVPEPAVSAPVAAVPSARAPVPEPASAPRSAVRASTLSDLSAPANQAPEPAVEPADVTKPEEPVPLTAKEKRAKKKRAQTLEDSDFPEPVESIFTTQTYVIGFIVIAAGGGFLFWQRQQRLLALEATAVSHTPFNDSAAGTSGASLFPVDLPAKLEWKRFEELVEAYYSKTGVVAVRNKTGPTSPVHIKISWKGEPRPFACVQCIAHPTGLVDVKAVQDLFGVLSAEDIRRGYVVTTGKFNVAARDFAEEKHITLLTGDIFLEKLNALPDPARAELIQEFSVGDYTTPSCPKCDTKMMRSPDDPAVWRCKSHADVTIPAWK